MTMSGQICFHLFRIQILEIRGHISADLRQETLPVTSIVIVIKLWNFQAKAFVLSYKLGKVTENTDISIEITDFKI